MTLHTLFTWGAGLAWVAMLIDYLEVPILLDQLHKVWQQRRVLLTRIRANLANLGSARWSTAAGHNAGDAGAGRTREYLRLGRPT